MFLGIMKPNFGTWYMVRRNVHVFSRANLIAITGYIIHSSTTLNLKRKEVICVFFFFMIYDRKSKSPRQSLVYNKMGKKVKKKWKKKDPEGLGICL